MFREEERIEALAKYLEVPTSDIEVTYESSDNLFTVKSSGEEYLVVDEDEAYQAAKLDIENLIDDLGIDSFSKDFQDWIFMNCVDEDWFAEALRESTQYYVDDIEDETYGQDKYANRLIEELVDNDILSDEDLEEDEDGSLTYNGDIDDAKERYVDYLVDIAGDPIQDYIDNFGSDSFTQVCKENMLIDWDKVVEECIDVDGVAHFISRWDSIEHDLGNGLYAYRQN